MDESLCPIIDSGSAVAISGFCDLLSEIETQFQLVKH
jgi:hypothetical protein